MEIAKILKIYKAVHSKIRPLQKVDVTKDSVVQGFVDEYSEHYGGSFGDIFVYDYILFQFEYWKDLDTRRSNIPLEWVFGPKARDRFDNKSENAMYFAKKMAREFGISREQFQDKAQVFSGPLPHEENERSRYFGTEKGLVFCVKFTSMYHPESRFCNKCSFSKECVALMKKTHPRTYLKRGLMKKKF